MSRPQFTLRSLLVAVLVVAAFFGGWTVGIQDERRRLGAEVSAEKGRYRNEMENLSRKFMWLK
jgi:hypothetical protein